MTYNHKLKVLRRGCNSTPALVEYDSLPADKRREYYANAIILNAVRAFELQHSVPQSADAKPA